MNLSRLNSAIRLAACGLVLVVAASAQPVIVHYDDVADFSEGLARVTLDGKHGFMDALGREVVAPRYESARAFSEGFAAVQQGGKWGFIDNAGREVVPPLNYDAVDAFGDGLAPVQRDGRWGYIDKTGREIVPVKYEDAYPFSEGLAAVQQADKWGFIDPTGKEVIPLKYHDVGTFKEGLAGFSAGRSGAYELWGFLDKSGREVLAANYLTSSTRYFTEGLLAVRRPEAASWDALGVGGASGRSYWVIIDQTGKEVFSESGLPQSERYGSIGRFHDGVANAWLPSRGRGLINTRGEPVTRFIYDHVADPASGYAVALSGGKRGIIDLTGKVVVPFDYAGATSVDPDGFAWLKAGDNRWSRHHVASYKEVNDATTRATGQSTASAPATQPGNDWETLWADPATRFQKLAASYLTATEADKTRHIEFLATKITPLWMESNLENKYLPIRAFISANFALIQAMPEGEQPPARQLLYQAIHRAGLIAAKSGHSHPGVLYNWIQPKNAP